MKRVTDLQADIVITGLPERGEALCDGLLERIRPKLIIVADSEYPATRRASPQLRERLLRQHIPLLYTRHAGGVTITVHSTRWTVSTACCPSDSEAQGSSDGLQDE